MSLSSFLLIMTLFIRLGIINGEKERFEIASDVSMNSVLGEYGKSLYERYDLLYIDPSYLQRSPEIENTGARLRLYLKKNTEDVLEGEKAPWGRIALSETDISAYRTAAFEDGSSMRSQANRYVKESPRTDPSEEEVSEAFPCTEGASALEEVDVLGEWGALMEAIEGKEKPVVREEDGTLRIVEVSNPADWVYALSGSEILYAAELMIGDIPAAAVDTGELISNRGEADEGIEGSGMDTGSLDTDKQTFLSYLVDRMGSRDHMPEDTMFKCELEYIISGEDNDYANYKEAIGRIFRIRFADNTALARNDGGLRGEAVAAAGLLEICTLDPSFIEPVAESILFAAAYLETLSDLKTLSEGGRVPLFKESHHMSVDHVLNGTRYTAGGDEGFTYRQYLILFLGMEEDDLLNFRTMDLMELEIRRLDSNPGFRMDRCIERLGVSIGAEGSGIGEYRVERTYGYY